MLCYLAGMEPYYLKCIKDGPFQQKISEGDAKPMSQWTLDERRVVVQDQRLKSIIMSCLPDDIMESVISCVSVKETWSDLVYSFEGPSDTKENRIMDLKLEYQTFRANLPEKWLTFSQGLRNANHTQTLDLADIYGRFVYEDNLIQRRYSDTKKALISTPSIIEISTAFFSNNDEEEVFDEEEVTRVKVLMALADDELTIGKSHARNDEWVDITIRKLNHALQEQLKEEKKINEKWLTSSKKVSQCINEQIPHQKKKVLAGELFTESSYKVNENLFIHAFMGYDQEMFPKTKDWVERLNPDSKLPKFNTGRILVPESQAVNESLEPT
ncbi:hypothetical protein Tco_0717718 [Tanacetum coccineum]